MGPPRRKRRFASLDPEKRGSSDVPPELKGIIFGLMIHAQGRLDIRIGGV